MEEPIDEEPIELGLEELEEVELDPEFPGELGMELEGVGLVDRAVEDETRELVAPEAAEELLGGKDKDDVTTELEEPE